MENVYLKEYQKENKPHNRGMGYASSWKLRERLVRQYAWAIPTDKALDLIAKHGPIVEMGAGTGYWAALLQSRGVDVKAFDLAPPTGMQPNSYKHTVGYTDVHEGEPSDLYLYSDRALFLCWPPYDTPMARECITVYKGDTLIYVGEGWGGCTGDDMFWELLDAKWEEVEHCEIPQFSGLHDSLTIFRRKA